MEFGTIGKDGTGSHINPQEMHLGAATTESVYTSQIAYWDLKNADQLKGKQNFPGLGQRDLLPGFQVGDAQPGYVSNHTQAPNVPRDFFAIANRADGMPLEVLQYSADNKGHLTYKQQYLFQYQNLPDGEKVGTQSRQLRKCADKIDWRSAKYVARSQSVLQKWRPDDQGRVLVRRITDATGAGEGSWGIPYP